MESGLVMGDKKYILFLVGAVLIYLGIKVFGPRDWDWGVTYAGDDKNPFGGYVLHSMMPDLFPENTISQFQSTFYEFQDSLQDSLNFLSISDTFNPDDEDVIKLLEWVDRGGHVFISAEYFYGQFADTLKINSSDYYYKIENFNPFNRKEDTAKLVFSHPDLRNEDVYSYPRNNIHNYFDEFDSVRTSVVAINDLDLPVTLRIKWGKGELYLNSTPMVFTNAYMLQGKNHQFVARSLSLLPPHDLWWTLYYHLGRMEAGTPLRFILSNEPLRWAYYLIVSSLLIFMVTEFKRKQRIIPVIKPLENTTLEFIETIGALYYQKADHKGMASKKIVFFYEFLRSRYGLGHQSDPHFQISLARRTGKEIKEVKELFQKIAEIESRDTISAEELISLNRELEAIMNL